MNSSVNAKIIRSKRKSIAVQITKKLEVIVRAPYFLSDTQISEFVASKDKWIHNHLEMMKNRIEKTSRSPESDDIFSEDEIRLFSDKAEYIISKRVSHFAPLIGVDYEKITIRCMFSRWGSCSSKGNLSFNCLLFLAPDNVIDYVVVHELCHRKQMNHSKLFYTEVERILPNYKVNENWLKENGKALIEKLKNSKSQ